MTTIVPIVDLFSGPGGLAEGFAQVCDSDGHRPFRIALSVEMERTAYRTLRLRAFLRKFSDGLPSEYYDFLNRESALEPDWAQLYPKKWQEACTETQCLKLGTSSASVFVRERIQEIRKVYGNTTVLVGGPPCQSYSLVGRARNAGNTSYDPDKDPRQSLYQEFVGVLAELQPAVAIMENVKGMLSARHEDQPVFSSVMEALCNAGGIDRYRLYGLTSERPNQCWRQGLKPQDFLVRSEEHGVPQSRHRIFVICIRNDVVNGLSEDALPRLEKSATVVCVKDLIGGMPQLRSRLSQNDQDALWQRVAQDSCKSVKAIQIALGKDQRRAFNRELDRAFRLTKGPAPPFRGAKGGLEFPDSCPIALREWIFDKTLTELPNNETRGHMAEDLTRYLFAAAFACAYARSPRARDFPPALAPKHSNWETGKFHDRFRVQLANRPSTTITSHISKDGHYFIHPDPAQLRSLTVREAARLQTFPDNYFFHGGRTQQYVQVGNAVPPFLAFQIAKRVWNVFLHHGRAKLANRMRTLIKARKEPSTLRFPVRTKTSNALRTE